MALVLEISTPNEWHVLKGETQYGPYSYEEMLSMLQNKTLYGFDFVWSPHLDGWTTLSDLAEFSADRISRIVEKSDDPDVFHRRTHERVHCKLPVYIHNNVKFWTGTVESLSSGGALILMENPLLLPGDQITIHFKSLQPDGKPFNAKGEIITKRLTKQRIEHDSQLYYAIKFDVVQPSGEKDITQFIDEKNKQATGKQPKVKGERV